MKTITKIAAADTGSVRKLRVAAYARVSTDSEEQLISLDAQKNHYEVLIHSRRDWEYAGHRCKCRIFAAHPIYRKRRKVQEGSSPPYGCGTAERIQLYSGREYHKEAAGKGAGFCG